MVPPMVDDIAEALTWILWDAPQPIGCSYALIIINLYDICTFGSTSMHIREAHFRVDIDGDELCALFLFLPYPACRSNDFANKSPRPSMGPTNSSSWFQKFAFG